MVLVQGSNSKVYKWFVIESFMNSAQNAKYGRRIRELFSKAGGSNYMEHDPLSFESNGEKGKVDPKQLQTNYVGLFCDMASSAIGGKYLPSFIPVRGVDPSKLVKSDDGRRLVIHPEGVKPLEAAYVYYFNQWTFLCEGIEDFPLIQVQSYDLRQPIHNQDKSSVFLRFTNGTLKNKQNLFQFFESAINLSGLPYERSYSGRNLESLDFDLEFSP
jgi:hypothetical protein